ncbi:MAG: alpha/beta hydrolase fold protein [Hyphomicrobiales bacterium]|nr:alpha/beta hydrolase fold protein [Hyphomicrobiales bacterium]
MTEDVKKTELELCGARISIMRAGHGQPLLILRGGDASDDWRPFMDALAAKYDVIVPEHPGFGGKAKPEWLDSTRDYANYYLDFLEALDLRGVHVVGFALGGWIAAELATRDCSRIASLALVSPFGIFEQDAGGLDTFLRSEEQGVRDMFHNEAVAEAELARVLAPETEDVRLSNQITIAQVSWTPRNYDPDLRKWLHRVHARTLIVWGAQDRILPAVYAQAWGKLIPGSRVEIMPDCGHAPQIEQPERFVRLVDSFIAEQRATS